MKRRDFVTLIGGAAVWPLAARGQQREGMRRIGVLMGVAEDDSAVQEWLAAFREGLQKFGWFQGRNVRLDYRFVPASADQVEVAAKELAALQPDVILAHGTGVSTAMRLESRSIPIVFVAVSDPVGSGFIASMARPGGNLTGLLQYEEGIAGKWLAMLKEIAPRSARVALIANPKNMPYDYFLRGAEAVAPQLAIELLPSRVENASDIARDIELLARLPNGGLVLLPDPLTVIHRDLIVTLAARHRLPAVYPFRVFVVAGGLLCYGIDRVDMYREAASYVDRILRGAKPAQLPVQAPVKYETVLNMNTAKALGLTVPHSLLVRADEVIEQRETGKPQGLPEHLRICVNTILVSALGHLARTGDAHALIDRIGAVETANGATIMRTRLFFATITDADRAFLFDGLRRAGIPGCGTQRTYIARAAACGPVTQPDKIAPSRPQKPRAA